MEADQTAKADPLKSSKKPQEFDLNVSRKSLKDWSCRFADHSYEILSQVGEGTFRYLFIIVLIVYSNVYKARSKDAGGTIVALKKIKQDQEKEGMPITALREIKILSQLKHPNIVNLIEVVVRKVIAPQQKYIVYLVFEYLEHDLHGLIDKRVSFDVPQIKYIMQQILQGVKFLHENEVMHRDIKGANILLDNKGHVKLADFGLSKKIDPRRNYTNRVVTLWYRCPELLLGSEKYTPAIDMWSIGCCFAELLTFRPLFPADKEQKVLELIYEKCGTPTEETWPGMNQLKHFKQLGPKKFQPSRLREELLKFPKYFSCSLLLGWMGWQ